MQINSAQGLDQQFRRFPDHPVQSFETSARLAASCAPECFYAVPSLSWICGPRHVTGELHILTPPRAVSQSSESAAK
jgi:hypothetical protein